MPHARRVAARIPHSIAFVLGGCAVATVAACTRRGDRSAPALRRHNAPKLGALVDGWHLRVPDGVQWDGAHVVGSTPLTGSADVNQFWIAGRRIVGPDSGDNDVGFWKYPVGVTATKILSHTDMPVGSAVSVAR